MDIDNNEEKVEEKVKLGLHKRVIKEAKNYLPFVLELAKIAVIAFIIVAPIRYFLFQPFIVSGASMAPNFATGDYLIIDEISYRFSTPQRGDVVVFDAGFIKGYEGQRFIKRMIGLPGETVEIKNGKVDVVGVDGKKIDLNEKYLSQDLKTFGNISLKLNADQYFVLGDNRDYSYDSRMWGAVPAKYIIGKASLRIFPVNNMSQILRPAY